MVRSVSSCHLVASCGTAGHNGPNTISGSVDSLRHHRLYIACQAALSMGFSRQYWNGLPFPPPGDLSDPEIEPVSPALAGKFFTNVPPGRPGVLRFMGSQRSRTRLSD